MQFDRVVRNCRVVTASEEFTSDIGIRDGRVALLGFNLPVGSDDVDAKGRIVTPGGVDVHCHLDEPVYQSARLADGFRSASRAAACGGTTTIVPFVNQEAGRRLADSYRDYRDKARESLIDFSFHLILASVDEDLLRSELAPLLEAGLRSVKVFMTYPGYMMDDAAMLAVMAAVKAVDGIVMVHAENGHCAEWSAARLEEEGRTGLSHFAEAFPQAIEREAVHRAISLAEIVGAKLMIVHVSGDEAMEQIRWSRRKGHRTLAETCPQYLVGLGDRLRSAGDGWETAKLICSPPPRPREEASDLWAALRDGSLDLVSSDHCPYRFEGADGKKASGRPDFQLVPPGLPGLELRLPLLFEEGVVKKRIGLQRFVELTSTRPAQIYGLYPRKGSLMPGADADLVIWDTDAPRTVRHADLHDECDYSPYEGMQVSAWPRTTLSRGEVVWDRGTVLGQSGRGRFLGAPGMPGG